jgi:hypothetical protein
MNAKIYLEQIEWFEKIADRDFGIVSSCFVWWRTAQYLQNIGALKKRQDGDYQLLDTTAAKDRLKEAIAIADDLDSDWPL